MAAFGAGLVIGGSGEVVVAGRAGVADAALGLGSGLLAASDVAAPCLDYTEAHEGADDLEIRV